jgi:hypothetical protein
MYEMRPPPSLPRTREPMLENVHVIRGGGPSDHRGAARSAAWIPAFAGMTMGARHLFPSLPRTRESMPETPGLIRSGKSGHHRAAAKLQAWIPAFAGMTRGGP